MADEDLNLLTALDALLTEGSVAGAASRMGLSASAMSRTLARLRAATGDQLLVRAGRGLVATPYAEALRDRVRDVADEARAVLRPTSDALEIRDVERLFTIRAHESFVEVHAARLVALATAEAPGVVLRFAPKPDKDVRPLREGLIDLDVGVLGATGPEVRVQALFRDRFVGVARVGHPIFASAMTPERYAGFNHVVASRRGRLAGPVDEALGRIGLQRKVVAIVPGFSAALAIAAASDLVALVTETAFETDVERRTTASGRTILAFDLPVATPAITVSQMWHPRFDADPAHRWLRRLMLTCCGRDT